HTRSKRDWSSDVCSSDLRTGVRYHRAACRAAPRRCPVYDVAEYLGMRWDEGIRSTSIPREEQTMPAQTPKPSAPLDALVSRAEEIGRASCRGRRWRGAVS